MHKPFLLVCVKQMYGSGRKIALDSVLIDIMSEGGDVSIRPYDWAYWIPMWAADQKNPNFKIYYKSLF